MKFKKGVLKENFEKCFESLPGESRSPLKFSMKMMLIKKLIILA